MKRAFAVLLAVLMIIALVGCGKAQREVIKLTLSTEDAEAILAAAGIMLPDAETTACAGSVVKWYAWYDSLQNYSEDEIVNTGYFTFNSKYGCTLKWVECTWAARFDDLANLVLGGTPPDCYPGDIETFPAYAIKGVFQPVNDYIDYNDPLWVGTADFAAEHFSLGDKAYMIITDIGIEHVCAYNRRVIDEWGFDDPAELFANDEWTWDAFLEMCKDFSDPDEEQYGVDGWGYDNALMESSGVDIVTYDTEKDCFVQNIDDPRLERSANLIYERKKNDCIYPLWLNGWQLRGGAEVEGIGLKEGKTLFWLRGTWAFTAPVAEVNQVWGDIEAGELMFVPIPRDPNGDGNYYCTTKTNGYVMIADCDNPEGVALLASCDRFKVLDPTVISVDKKQLIEKYKWTQEMLDMYDLCHEMANGPYSVVVYDAGLGDKLDSVVNNCKELGRLTEAKSWAQVKESYSEQLKYYVDDINKQVEEYTAKLK